MTARWSDQAAAAGDLTAMEQLPHAEAVDRRADRAREFELTPDSSLPELDGERLRFGWDFEEADGERWTVIRCSDLIVWRELAYWGGRDRLDAVTALLSERFGERFDGLHPTDASLVYLAGD